MASDVPKKIDSSSIINMEVMGEDDSDYETNFVDTGTSSAHDDGLTRKRTTEFYPSEGNLADSIKKNMAQNVTSYVWQAGTQHARKAFSVYGNIDVLRPYFDVEPHEVRDRLLRSLVPTMPSAEQRQKVPRELYGPTMLIFTLIALLLFQMKTGGHSVQEGTLMGTAFGTCFGYWLGLSGFTWFLAYVCNTHITMLQLLCLIGYALFGHCIVMLLTTLVHTSHDHLFFYLMWGIFGGLSTLKLISVLTSRTTGQTQKLIVCGVVATFHLCFLLYLHFAYHQIVEELNAVIEGPGPHPIREVTQRTVLHHDNVRKMVERSADNLVVPPMKAHETPDKAHVVHASVPSIDNIVNKVSNPNLDPSVAKKPVVKAGVNEMAGNDGSVMNGGVNKRAESVLNQEVIRSHSAANRTLTNRGNSMLKALAPRPGNGTLI